MSTELAEKKEEQCIIHSVVGSQKTDSKERVSFVLPSLNRDQQINLGQSIVALIGINLPTYFTDEQNKEDIGLMFIDILKHYNISIEELYKMDLLENRLDPDYSYEIEVELKHKVLSKEEC